MSSAEQLAIHKEYIPTPPKEIRIFLNTAAQSIAQPLQDAYVHIRRALRKTKTTNQEETLSVWEFNPVALVDRYIDFSKQRGKSEETLQIYMETIRSDISTWITEFLRKAERDVFTITVNKQTGRITNDAYKEFSDDLMEMMDKNITFLEERGENTKRAGADKLHVKNYRDWALQAKVGETSISISPKYKESEVFKEDNYEFVFFRRIKEITQNQIVIETIQYKTWLTLTDMRIFLQQLGYSNEELWGQDLPGIAEIVHPLKNNIEEQDILFLLNALSRNPNKNMPTPIFTQANELEQYISIAQEFLVQEIPKRLRKLHSWKKDTVLEAQIIEEAINFARRYPEVAKNKLLLGKQHEALLEDLTSSFEEYIEVKYLGKRVSEEEAENINSHLNFTFGGMLQQISSTTQCYGSIFKKIGIEGTNIQAPNYPFAGLGRIRPEGALLLKDSMNCPHCEKNVLVWRHPNNRIQCSHCGNFRECGSNEFLSETISPPIQNDVMSSKAKAKNISKPQDISPKPQQEQEKSDPRMIFFSFFAPAYLRSL